jgi:LacI family transcriptional regulator
LKPELKISIVDLAARVGLSAATVSRVLNQRAGISQATRQKVLDAAREAGFRPRVATRQTTIGIVIDYVSPELGLGMVDALHKHLITELGRHAFAIEVFTGGYLDALPNRFLDGILAVAWVPATLTLLESLDVPVVIFNRPERTALHGIALDAEATGYLAGRHLIEQGHRRIGFIGWKPTPEREAQVAGLRRAAAESGLEIPDACIAFTHLRPPIAVLQGLLAQGITGLMTEGEQLTTEIPYLAGDVLKLSLPRDLSLVGWGIDVALKHYRPPMTIVSPPVARMTKMAVELLSHIMSQGIRDRQLQLVPPELIVRDSVARLPSASDRETP